MSQLSLVFDASLMIRDEQGRYLPATAEQILDAARKVIDQKVQRGAAFTSSELVKEYLITKLGGFEHEVFSALFLDAKHRLIQYVEMFRGTIDSASVYPRGGQGSTAPECSCSDLRAQSSKRKSRAKPG